MSTLGTRLRRDDGLTLIELLIVFMIMAILVVVAVPSYLKFKDRANASAARANVRSVVPALEAYKSDHDATGYSGATLSALQASYDAAIKNVDLVSTSATTYCVSSQVGDATYYKAGPGSDITTTPCA